MQWARMAANVSVVTAPLWVAAMVKKDRRFVVLLSFAHVDTAVVHFAYVSADDADGAEIVVSFRLMDLLYFIEICQRRRSGSLIIYWVDCAHFSSFHW